MLMSAGGKATFLYRSSNLVGTNRVTLEKVTSLCARTWLVLISWKIIGRWMQVDENPSTRASEGGRGKF